MRILIITFFFNLFLFFTLIGKNICSNSFASNTSDTIVENNGNNEIKIKGNSICNIKNCLLCDKRNECIKCLEGYELDKRRCYSKNCDIYGFCKFCDEYDCLKCLKGYKLNYGICNEKVHSPKKIIIISLVVIVILYLFFYLCFRYHKKAKEKIKTGQVLKFLHPKPGYYQLNFETSKSDSQDSSQNKSLGSSTSETTGDRDSPITNCCVICGNKKTYTIADCGCSVCEEHFRNIKSEKEKILCRVHKNFINCNISFKMAIKSDIKGNALEKLGLVKCPICKIKDGTQSFNCGCPMKVCENCFNDNVYVFKYNQCPGCGMPYNPLKSKKRKKSNNDNIEK